MKIAVALGANLGEREKTLEGAIKRIGEEVGSLLASSKLMKYPALIHPDRPDETQPDFLNAVAVFETELSPIEILDCLLKIEKEFGRVREESLPWAARTLDLDLIAVGDTVLDTPRLILPHPEMHKRDFVLEPMAEVWPEWRHPILGRTVAEMLAGIG